MWMMCIQHRYENTNLKWRPKGEALAFSNLSHTIQTSNFLTFFYHVLYKLCSILAASEFLKPSRLFIILSIPTKKYNSSEHPNYVKLSHCWGGVLPNQAHTYIEWGVCLFELLNTSRPKLLSKLLQPPTFTFIRVLYKSSFLFIQALHRLNSIISFNSNLFILFSPSWIISAKCRNGQSTMNE